MSKRDRQGVRTASDLERKYDFGSLGKGGNQDAKISQLMQSLTDCESKIKNLTDKIENICPVGSIHISADDTEPSTVFGGTWELVKQGYLVVGLENDLPQLEYLDKCNVWKRIE